MKCQLAIRIFAFFLNRTPQVGDVMEGWRRTLQFNLEGERPFHLVINDAKAHVIGSPSVSPDVVFEVPAPLFLRMMLDTAVADEAYVNKKYEVHGAPADATRFRVLGERVQQYHPFVFGSLRKLGSVITRMS